MAKLQTYYATGSVITSFINILGGPSKTADIEKKIMEEHIGQFQSEEFSKEEQEHLTMALIQMFNTEKQEGERVVDFENRVRKETETVLGFTL